jgi:hypothetical protein
VRTVNLVSRPDFNGFGFSIRPSPKGPHQISSVEENSPGHLGGLRQDDLILKVNDQNVVGQRFSKTAALIKNESEKGRIKLEVVEPALCPDDIRNTTLVGAAEPASAQSTLRAPSSRADSIQNLKNITAEALVTGSGSSSVRLPDTADRNRGVSVDTGLRQRPQSMSNIDRIQQNSSTVRSSNSFYSSTTGLSANNGLQSARSMGNLAPTDPNYRPKFKRCTITLIPEFPGLGFTLNSKIKPKYMIYSVDPNSPAYAGNLRTNDIIVEIDRKNIRKLKFDKVRQMLSEIQKKGQVEILAIDLDGYKWFKKRRQRFSSTRLVTQDNTEPYSTYDGLRSREQSINNGGVSSDIG